MLNSGDSYEEEITSMIWKTTSTKFHFSLNISSSYVNIEWHTENQSAISGEDLKNRIWKTTSSYFQFVLNISSRYATIKWHTHNENQPSSLINSGDSYEEDLKLEFGKPHLDNSIFS